MKRIRHWRGLLLSFAILIAACLFVFYSETALRWGVSLLAGKVLQPLSVVEVHGRLAGPFTLKGVAYDDAGYRISLETITVNWKPSALLNATAHVTEFTVKGFHFEQHQQPAKATPAETPATLPDIRLPVTIIVDDASIDGITLDLPEQRSPILITQLALKAETQADTVRVNRLHLTSDWLTLDLNGNIQPYQDYKLKLNLSWLVPQPNSPPWQGNGTLQGNLRQLDLQQRLVSPFAASLNLQGKNMLDDLTWAGTLKVPQMKSSQLPFPVSPAFTVGGELQAKGDLETVSGTSSFAGKVDTIGALKGKIAATFAKRQLHLTLLELNQTGGPAHVEAEGKLDLATPLRYQLVTRWQHLGWPLEKPSFQSEEGQLNLSGENTAYQFDGSFLLSGSQIPNSNWQLKGNGDDKAVTVSALDGKLLDGSVTANADVTFLPQVKWKGKLAATNLNPAVKWEPWPGRISAKASVNGQLTKSGIDMAVLLSSLKGILREHKLDGHAEGSLRGDTASLKRLEVQLGSARLQANGAVGKTIKLDWKLDARELADLLPQGQGKIKAKGNITGPLTTPKIAMLMDGVGVGVVNIRSDKLHADIDIDLQRDNPSRAIVQLQQLQLPGMPQQSLTVKLDGPLDNHRLAIESQSTQQTLQLAVTAGYDGRGWAGDITRLQIDDKKLGQWQLAQPTPFSLLPGDMQLTEFCLNHAEANLCAGGQWTDRSGVSAALRSARFPLQLLAPYLPRRFGINAELNGKVSLAMMPQSPPRVEANLTLGQGELRLLSPEDESTLTALPFQKVVLRLDTSEQGKVDGGLVLSFNESDRLELSFDTKVAKDWQTSQMQQPLQARLQMTLRDMSPVSRLLPEVENVKGTLDADIRLIGTAGDPKLSGYLRLEKGALDIPRAGVSLTDLELAASGDNTKKMDITGKARSGDGNLTITGQFVPTDKKVWALELTMKGKNFVVANIPEARMQVSPDLRARIAGREIRLEGDLDIPSARLEPPDIKLAVKPSDDVVILGEEEEKARQERWLIYTQLRLHAADSIRFIGYGFDGRIGGDLLLIDEPGSLTRGRGVLDVVSGSTYEAFSKKLNIDRGRLNFADSPVQNPNLDIRASRTIGTVIAGVNVTGTAKKPVLTLFSEPPMDQADILAYLTLGHPISSASKGEAETMAGAVNSAGLVGGNYLAGYLGRQFGLEEAGVDVGPNSQTPWLVVGKYLSPRLYVRYGVGVYEDVYSVLVRYKLSDHWQVQGIGGLNSGADIIYTFERP